MSEASNKIKQLLIVVISIGFNTVTWSQNIENGDDKGFYSGEGMNMVEFTSSNLPIIIINTVDHEEITKSPRLDATMKIVYDSIGGRNLVTGPFTNYNGKISIKGRGSSSWEFYPKKGYGFETRTELDSNNNVSLLGMPKENDWVLHGPYADKTLMKNAFVYKIGREMGRYAPRTRFCELVLNDVYTGVYLLTEKIKRDKNRLDIAKLNPDEISGDDLTGGYLLSIDRQKDEFWPPLIDFNGGFSQYNYIYPDPTRDMPQVQKDYIRDYVTSFERALNENDFGDVENGYRAYINLPSFIDFFIINELTKNIDAYRLSTYMYKDKDSKGGKLTMGPIWDHNFSCGGVNIGFGNWGATAENWIYQEYNGQPFWWRTFLEDPYYNACLKKRWFELREDIIHEDHFNAVIDSFAVLLDEAKERNFEIHPLGDPVWGNDHAGFTYAQEVDTLKGYLKQRIAWIDSEMIWIPDNAICHECFTCAPGDSVVTALSASSDEFNSVRVYPNPFENHISFRLKLYKASKMEINIYDISGNNMKQVRTDLKKDDHELAINLSGIGSSGIYIYTVISDDTIIGSGNIIKQ